MEEKGKVTTPTREAIITKARELWHEDRSKHGDPSYYINPTLQELRECGFLSLAKSELMRGCARAEAEEWEGYGEGFDKIRENEKNFD